MSFRAPHHNEHLNEHVNEQNEHLQNAPILKGRIALIERGSCTFQNKAVRAFNAGAIGIIFANYDDELYQPCALPHPDNHTHPDNHNHPTLMPATPIPMLCVAKRDAAMLADGMIVGMHFTRPAASIAGRAAHVPVDGAASPQRTARQHVLTGGLLQEWTRGKHTGSFVAGHVCVKVTETAEVLWRHRRCRIKRVRDGFGSALSSAKPAESNSKCGFTVRVESDERVSEVYDLELMAASDHDKMLWISGILQVVHEQESAAAPIYSGERVGGIPKGKGLGVFANGDQYMGEWDSGLEEGTTNGMLPLRNGQGVYAWRNGDLYRGEWLKGVRAGFGTLENSNGAIYQGQWLDDRISGAGIQVSSSKDKYVGTFLEGFRHGFGVLTLQDGTKRSTVYAAGIETKKAPFPHPNAAMQENLKEMSAEARSAAKKAGHQAEAAQAMCAFAEGLINQVSAATSFRASTTFANLQAPIHIPASAAASVAPSVPSTPSSIRPMGTGGPTHTYTLPRPVVLHSLHSLPRTDPAFPGSPIDDSRNTPYASMAPGAAYQVQAPGAAYQVQAPTLGVGDVQVW